MPVQAVNQYAMRRYQDLIAAVEMVQIALAEIDPVIAKMADKVPGRVAGWLVPDKKEVLAARTRVVDQLDVLRVKVKEYEKRLIANGWRV